MNVPTRTPAKRNATFHQVLIIIFGTMLLGGGDGRPLDERVSDVIDDPGRAERVVAIARRLDRREEDRVSTFVEWRSGFFDVLASHDSGRADIDGQLRELMRELQRAETELVQTRFELRDALTEDEWRAVFE